MPLYPASNLNFINLKDYCKLDGVSDDSTGFTNAYTLASTLGRGLFHPGGTLVKGNDTLLPNVPIVGAGYGLSVIKLKNGANTDLFSAQTGSINLSASSGTGSAGTLYNFGFSDISLDGNKANQTSGTSYPLRFYGYGFFLHNVRIRNGYTGGLLCDWNGGGTVSVGDSMEAQVTNLKVHDNNGIGIQWGGPHDSQLTNVDCYLNGSHCYHIGPNATAMLFLNSHGWGPATGNSSVAWLIEAGYGQYVNCVAEGSDTVQVALLGPESRWDGHIFGAGAFSVSGLQIGQAAGGTPYNGSTFQSAGAKTAATVGGCYITGYFSRCEGANGAIWFVNDGGNFINVQSYQTAGNCYTGTPSPKTFYTIHALGLTADGTQGKGGTSVMPINAFSALVVRDDNFTDIFNLNTTSKNFSVPNNVEFRGYKDGYSTLAFQLNPDGNGSAIFKGSISEGQSASAAATATSGTITTSGVGEARVAPTGAITGVILQAGTVAGQRVSVVNESAFTVTFAAVATSNVADGVSAVIAANRKMDFSWDSGTSKWYHS